MATGRKNNNFWNECYSTIPLLVFLNFITNIFVNEVPKLSDQTFGKRRDPLLRGIPQVISNQNVKCAAYH
jgi:hypothetical protein